MIVFFHPPKKPKINGILNKQNETKLKKRLNGYVVFLCMYILSFPQLFLIKQPSLFKQHFSPR